MKRFLTVLAFAAVAGAMYVAAAPGSRTAAGPTEKQFKALQKQVTKLQKQVKNIGDEADGEGSVILYCMLNSVIGVSQKGDTAVTPTFGYSYTPSGGSAGFTTGLDLAPTNTATYLVTPFNSDPNCTALIGVLGLRHLSRFAPKH